MKLRHSLVFSLGLALAGVGCGPRSTEIERPGAGKNDGPKGVSRVEPEPEPEPEPAPGPPRVLVTIRYADGALAGRVEDREVRVGERTFKMSRLRCWHRGQAERVEPDEGAVLDGKVEGLEGLEFTIGGRLRQPDLSLAKDVYFEAPLELAPVPGLDELKKGHFLRPFYSVNPVTSYRASAGAKVEDRSITKLQPEFLIYSSWMNQGRMGQLIRAERTPIEVGKVYENNDGRGTKFIVWEMEKADHYENHERKPYSADSPKEGSPYKRLAIDYTGMVNDRGGPGMIRYNSSFK